MRRFHEGGVLDLTHWIAGYEVHLASHGYKACGISRRLKYLRCFAQFVQAKGLGALQEFLPDQTAEFADYWVHHYPWARTVYGFTGKSRLQLHHHQALQYSLRAFFRWASSSGRLPRDPLALPPPVRKIYSFPEAPEYLQFCREHKGLAQNSLDQIELFVHRFDQFLRCQHLDGWSSIRSHHIDLFTRQQAPHNMGRIRRIHSILRGLFRYLFSLGRVDRDWAAAIVSPRRYRLDRTPRPPSAEQVLRLLGSIDRRQPGRKRDFAIVLMAASLGVRASEIAALLLEDIDWEDAVVRFPPIKSKNFLYLPLSRPLLEALADYLENARLAGSPYRNMFLSGKAPLRPMTPSSVSKLIARKMRLAGIQATGHQLRHAFASELLRSGAPFSTLQELLGHADFTSTQVYTKIDLVQLAEVADNDGEDF
jgi:site-specific recombinase XerD